MILAYEFQGLIPKDSKLIHRDVKVNKRAAIIQETPVRNTSERGQNKTPGYYVDTEKY